MEIHEKKQSGIKNAKDIQTKKKKRNESCLQISWEGVTAEKGNLGVAICTIIDSFSSPNETAASKYIDLVRQKLHIGKK